MQRFIVSSVAPLRTSMARMAVAPQVSHFSTDKLKLKGSAEEEKYFREIAAEQKNSFMEKLHAKELRALLQVLPKNHNLSSNDLHNVLLWKHEQFDVDLK